MGREHHVFRVDRGAKLQERRKRQGAGLGLAVFIAVIFWVGVIIYLFEF